MSFEGYLNAITAAVKTEIVEDENVHYDLKQESKAILKVLGEEFFKLTENNVKMEQRVAKLEAHTYPAETPLEAEENANTESDAQETDETEAGNLNLSDGDSESDAGDGKPE